LPHSRRQHHRTEEQLSASAKFDAHVGLLKYDVKKHSRVFHQCQIERHFPIRKNFNLCLTQVGKLAIKPNAYNSLRTQPGYLSYIIHKGNPQQR
jgi:hypothetical protein